MSCLNMLKSDVRKEQYFAGYAVPSGHFTISFTDIKVGEGISLSTDIIEACFERRGDMTEYDVEDAVLSADFDCDTASQGKVNSFLQRSYFE